MYSAVGKSRSAACVIAYMMQELKTDPAESLSQLRSSRPMVQPNEGLLQQLDLYHDMGCPDDPGENPAYQRWLWLQELERSKAAGQVPEYIYFEDEHERTQPELETGRGPLRCRSCRRTLALPRYLAAHDANKPPVARSGDGIAESFRTCAHYFIEPLTWMREELELGKLEGRLNCPKCRSNVGRYAWQGMQCSCGTWQTPSISLAKGKIDAAVSVNP